MDQVFFLSNFPDKLLPQLDTFPPNPLAFFDPHRIISVLSSPAPQQPDYRGGLSYLLVPDYPLPQQEDNKDHNRDGFIEGRKVF